MGTKGKSEALKLHRRESPRSLAGLIERFHNPETSEEEAHGLLDRFKEQGPKFGLGPMYDGWTQTIEFLCAIGDEVNIHASVVASQELRCHARIILARHVLGDQDFSHTHYDSREEAKRDAMWATVYRFYAASAEHCYLNESDHALVRAFFAPNGGGRRNGGDPRAFAQALINLLLSDVLEERGEIGAIPILYAYVREPLHSTAKQHADESMPKTLAWNGWHKLEDAANDHDAVLRVLRAWIGAVPELERDLDFCVRRAATVIEWTLFEITVNQHTSLEHELTAARTLLTLVAYLQRVYHKAQRA